MHADFTSSPHTYWHTEMPHCGILATLANSTGNPTRGLPMHTGTQCVVERTGHVSLSEYLGPAENLALVSKRSHCSVLRAESLLASLPLI